MHYPFELSNIVRIAMDNAELTRLAKDIESDRVERKESLSEKDRICQAICAFSNDLPHNNKPGVLFVGLKDDGTSAGRPVTDELLLSLADLRSDGRIQPMPSITVQKRNVDGADVAVVIVQPSFAPPVRFNGVVWVRVGPRRAVATRDDERRLSERRRAGDLPFDLRPVSTATLDDLQLDVFEREYIPQAFSPETLEQNQRTVVERLTALRFTDSSGIPSVLGVLVLGKDSRRFIPGAYIQFLRFEGATLTDPIRDQKEIDGTIAEQLRRLDEILEAHNSISTSITGGPIEVRRPEYPLPALQQLTRNAVLHRAYEGTNAPVRVYWFSDRIEIHSPGGPFGQVNRENFGMPGVADYRNPGLAEVLKVLGFVQRFGIGIQVAQRELTTNGNPPAVHTVEDTFILATVRRAK